MPAKAFLAIVKQRFLSSPYPDLSVSGKAVTSVFKLNFALSPSIVMRACKGNLSVILLRLPACEEQNSECTLHLVYQFCIGKRSKTVCKKGRCPAFFANCPRNKVAIPIRDTSGTPVFTEKAPEFAPLTAENPAGFSRSLAFIVLALERKTEIEPPISFRYVSIVCEIFPISRSPMRRS